MRERIQSAIGRSRARFAEVRFERIERTVVESRSRTLVQFQSDEMEGGLARVLAAEGGWGSASFSSLERVDEALEQALLAAQALAADRVDLAPSAAVVDQRQAVLKQDFRRVPMATKRELVQSLEDEILGFDASIHDAGVLYRDSFRTVQYGNSEGTWIEDERPLTDLRLEAVATRNGQMQSAREGLGRVQGFECVAGQEGLARSCARRAVELLAAKPVMGGVYTVITDPALTGVFVHEAFGHLLEADHFDRNPRLAELVRPGREVGPAILNVVDYAVPEEATLMGNFSFDDEGVPSGRTELVRDGVLVGRLHSRESAGRLGERPTGNARAQDFRFVPLVRMSKTVIARGTTPIASLFEGIALGIYARGSRGGQTELGRFSFAAEEAYMIRDGCIAERVRDVTLSGNIFDTLAGIAAIGDDFKLESSGRCGKMGQAMPVSVGGPHVRFERLVVGGTQA